MAGLAEAANAVRGLLAECARLAVTLDFGRPNPRMRLTRTSLKPESPWTGTLDFPGHGTLEAMDRDDAERQKRAAARAARMSVRKGEANAPGSDPVPLTPEQAVSLVHELTLAAWSLAGRSLPRYTRDTIPMRIIPSEAD